jgi:hypothetical protein
MARSLARRPVVVLIVLVVVLALILGYGGLRDALNPALASAQGCPDLLMGDTFAFNYGCPLDVHPWLLP